MSIEELAPADSLSEEEFDAEFEKMLREPVGSDESDEDSEDNSQEEEVIDEPVNEDADDGDEASEEEDEEVSEDEVEQHDEESDEADKDTLDEETESGSEDDSEDSTEDESPVSEGYDFASIPMDVLLPVDIAVNGTKVKATMNELFEGFKKGMNYTQKMQELAPVRKSMSIVTSNDISEEDLNLLVELKSGSKEAAAKLMSQQGIDPLDIDTDEHKDYTPSDYGKEELDVDMDMVRKEILADTENVGAVEDAISNMPEDMYGVVSSTSGNLKALHSDIKAGIYQQVMPEVMKLQALYGKTEPTMDMYLKVANKFLADRTEESSPAAQESNKAEQTARANKRAKVAPQTKRPKKESFIKDDVKAMGDDEFEKNFAKIMGRSIDDFR